MKTFVTRCKVGDMETESEGNSKKVSKKKAAELMLEKLKELPALPPSVIRPRTKISKKKNKNIIKVGPVFCDALLWILNHFWLEMLWIFEKLYCFFHLQNINGKDDDNQ